MHMFKMIALIVGMSALLLSGCGGGGDTTTATTPATTTKITPAIRTQITGSNAVSTISISGATSPIIYAFQLTVNFPAVATFSSSTATGVNIGNFVTPSNPGIGNVVIASAVFQTATSTGIGSGDVLIVNFTNVPNSAQATDFTVTGFTAKDSNGTTLP